MLYNISRRDWDDDLLNSSSPAGDPPRGARLDGVVRHDVALRPRDPSFGNAGDQQAALFGQGCVRKGAMKNTYGTGCFMMVNAGSRRLDSKAGLLTTLACGPKGETVFALEGAVFIAGAAIQYLRDSLKIIEKAEETEALAKSVPSTGGVYLGPRLRRPGRPVLGPERARRARGLTRGSGRAEIVRAALESIAYQTRDMIEAGGVKVRRAARRTAGRPRTTS
jgi:glycerol kinase